MPDIILTNGDRPQPSSIAERSSNANWAAPSNGAGGTGDVPGITTVSASPRSRKSRCFQTLRRNKLLLAGSALLGGLLGYAIVLPQVRIYQARTTIEVAGINESFLNIKQSDPVASPGTGGDATDIQTQITILKSDSLRDRVLAKLDTPAPAAPEPITLLTRLGLARRNGTLASGEAVGMAAQSENIRPIPGTRVIEITIDSTRPVIAATFANTLVNEFIEQNIETRWQSSMRTGEWLSHQLDEMRVKIENSEGRLQQYAKSAGLVFTSDKSSLGEQQLRQLQEARSTAETERIAKQSRFEMLQPGAAGAVAENLTDDGLHGYKDKIADLQRMIAELSVVYTPEHAKTKSLQAQLDAVQKSYRAARLALAGKIGDQYQEALRKEHLLEAGYLAQTGQVVSEQEKTTKYNLLKAEAESDRQLYDSLQQQLKQASVASAMKASNIRIVDAAAVPAEPYKPNTPRSVIVGTLLGLFGAVGIALLRERSNQTIREVGEVVDILGVPELGLIPNARLALSRADQKLMAKNAQLGLPAGGHAYAEIDLVTWRSSRSIIADSFRSAVTSMLFASFSSKRCQRFVITSASAGEGKSTVASNLGVAIAEMGDRVLLIDGDLRNPRLQTIFSLEQQPGLSTLLQEAAAGSETPKLDQCVRPTVIPNLFVLPAGQPTSFSSSLLSSARLRETLEKLSTQFDKILIDTPPMLAIPDARILAKHADAVVLVVRAGKTTRDAAVAAYERLLGDGTELVGAIMNDWDPAASAGGYYGYGYKYDAYYQGRE
jgi:polysaccharide biosynthesis transport protein